MPYAVTNFQPTPNPNALKCILDRPLPGPARSFRSREQAAGDPLAEALFDVEGVSGVLLLDGWLTVNKAAGAEWAAVKQGVQKALGAA